MGLRATAIGLALGLPLAPLAGQALESTAEQSEPETSEGRISAAQALEQSRKVYGPPAPRRDCRQSPDDAQIVVCAEEEEDQSRFPVQSTAELDPQGDAATDNGIPRAPDFSLPPCVPSLLTVCSKFGGAAPPPVMVDFSKLPEAPEGSDADLIAKGKKKAD
jgi:hypothetical protein